MGTKAVLQKMDELVDAHVRQLRFYNDDPTFGQACMWVKQHRQNSRHRNSVLKLRVATNCSDWDTRMDIIEACSQEVIADNEYASGKPHWQMLEDLGVCIGMSREEIQSAPLLTTTQIAWAAWEGLMSNRHWLEGIVANTCAERVNVPGYGTGALRERGWVATQGERWKRIFGLKHGQLDFFWIHEKADRAHSDLGWHAVARFAEQYRMEDAVIRALDINLQSLGNVFRRHRRCRQQPRSGSSQALKVQSRSPFRSVRSILKLGRYRLRIQILGIAISGLAALTAPVQAEDFYKGKTIELVVGYTPGGGYDAYGRALAQFIGRHIAGEPNVIVKNMPGGASIKSLQYLTTLAPKDGTSFATFDQVQMISPLIYGERSFEPSKLSWLGSIAKGIGVCIIWRDSRIKTWDDLLRTPVVLGAVGHDDQRYTGAAILKNLFGAPIQIIAGYRGSSEVRIAMERGEIAGSCGDSWSSVKSTAESLLSRKAINVLMQLSIEKHPDLPNVPLIMDKATPAQQDALSLLFSPQLAGRPFAAPPGIPPERLAELRNAFDKTMQDPAFLAFTKQANLEVNSIPGTRIESLVQKVYSASQATVDAARAAIQ